MDRGDERYGSRASQGRREVREERRHLSVRPFLDTGGREHGPMPDVGPGRCARHGADPGRNATLIAENRFMSRPQTIATCLGIIAWALVCRVATAAPKDAAGESADQHAMNDLFAAANYEEAKGTLEKAIKAC